MQDQSHPLTIPAAIIIAGVLIAGAVIYTNKTATGPDQVANAGDSAKIELDPITDTDHIIGSPDAPIILVEYSDLECPYCKQFHSTMQAVMSEYGKDGKVAWVYRHFPLDPIHPKARKEAEAAECAAELGGPEMFWKYIDRIFAITPSNNNLDPQLLGTTAAELGLDKAAFQSCVDSGKYAAKVEEQYQGGIRAQVSGTPQTIIVTKNGNVIPLEGAQPISAVKSAIDSIMLAI